MRWTKIVAGIVILCMLFTIFIFIAPVLYPDVLFKALPPWIAHLHQRLLPDHTELTAQPYSWIVFAALIIMYAVASIDVRLSQYSTYGTARLARRRETRQFHTPGGMPRALRFLLFAPLLLTQGVLWTLRTARVNALVQRSGHSWFVMGTFRERKIGLNEHDQEEHVLITGPTGSRKTSFEIVGNLLREQGSRSLFIADLKNELYRKTAGHLAKSHQIWRFAPRAAATSHGYNPLAHVKTTMDATLLANTWVANTGEDRDEEAYWFKAARYLTCAVIPHVRATEPHAPFARVRDYIVTTPFDTLKDILTRSPSRAAREKTANFLDLLSKNERLVGSTMADIVVRFQLFDIDEARTATAINDIDFNAMVDDPTALFLSIARSEVEFYRPLLACFTMQMFRAWEQRAEDEENGALPRGVACYLEEFANIGYIPGFGRFVSTARNLRVALLMVIQNFTQVESLYGANVVETIQDNANTHLLFRGAGLRECRYYSERIGDTMVPTYSRTSRGEGGLFGPTDVTYTQGETRRRLFTPEELRTMGQRQVLMLRSSLPPLMLTATPYYEDRSVRHLADLPYHVTHLRKSSPAPASSGPHMPPPGANQPPQTVIDADQDDDQEKNQQHFLDEEEW